MPAPVTGPAASAPRRRPADARERPAGAPAARPASAGPDQDPGAPGGLCVGATPRPKEGSGGGIRTRDFRVMSPASYQTALRRSTGEGGAAPNAQEGRFQRFAPPSAQPRLPATLARPSYALPPRPTSRRTRLRRARRARQRGERTPRGLGDPRAFGEAHLGPPRAAGPAAEPGTDLPAGRLSAPAQEPVPEEGRVERPLRAVARRAAAREVRFIVAAARRDGLNVVERSPRERQLDATVHTGPAVAVPDPPPQLRDRPSPDAPRHALILSARRYPLGTTSTSATEQRQEGCAVGPITLRPRTSE